MKICNKDKIAKLVAQRKIIIESNISVDDHFLDQIRFGLRLDSRLTYLNETVDLKLSTKHQYSIGESLRLNSNSILESNSFHLGKSCAKFELPANIIATIHTRSKFARVGLEFLCSSNLMIPGFGYEQPSEIVYEIRNTYRLKNFYDNYTFYSFLIFYELDEHISFSKKNYSSRISNLFK